MNDVKASRLQARHADVLASLLISVCVSKLLHLEKSILDLHVAGVILCINADGRIVGTLPVIVYHPLIVECFSGRIGE